jgi:hypothetical protein
MVGGVKCYGEEVGVFEIGQNISVFLGIPPYPHHS